MLMLLSSLCCGIVGAQPIAVTLYNADNGLPQSSVTCLYQDSYGFIWVGSQNGLARFDGYTFESFQRSPVIANSIGDGYIHAIAEDANKNIWVGTRSGLSCLSRSTGQFRNIHFGADGRMPRNDETIQSLLFDRHGTLWLKTANALHHYYPEADSLVSYPFGQGLHNDYTTLNFAISPLMADAVGQLWVGTSRGLLKFVTHTAEFAEVPFPRRRQAPNIMALKITSEGLILVGTGAGLFFYDVEERACLPYRHHGKPLALGMVESITEGPNGSIVVGTQQQLVELRSDGSVHESNELHHGGRHIGLSEVMALMYDRSKVMWIGTQVGLMKWSRLQQRFPGHSKKRNGDNLFGCNVVASLLQEPSGITWVGTWGTGLFRFDPQRELVLEQYSAQQQGRYHICNDHVFVIFQRRNGDIIIGTNDGAMRRPASGGPFVGLGSKTLDALLNDNRIFGMAEDTLQRLYLATSHGLLRLSPDGGVLGLRSDTSAHSKLLSDLVYSVLIDAKGDVWTGTALGITRLTDDMAQAHHYSEVDEPSQASANMGEVLCLYQDAQGTLWAGSKVGLYRYRPSDNRFVQVLSNLCVYAMEEDNDVRLWLSTNDGLLRFVPEANMVRRFNTSDGLLSNEFNLGASTRCHNGEIMFGGLAGYNYFNPDSILVNYLRPRTAITRITVVDAAGRLNEFPPNTPTITVMKGFKALDIEFSSFDYNFPNRNEYRYKLEGFEEDWVELGTRHSVHYTNLSENRYRFVLQSSNCDLIWSDGSVSLNIVVKSPFWTSKLGYAMYFLLALMLLAAYMLSRRKMLKRMGRLLEDREQALADIQLKTDELTMANKNITDSIQYAKRIQRAMMPSLSKFRAILPESFVLYMPKDIVSGDFYWINETRNRIFVAMADCTGHGVPGAFMSIIGMELMRHIINTDKIDDAAEVLNLMSHGVRDVFASGLDGGLVQVKDSMDVAFCVIDREYNLLQYAGAFSNLLLVRQGKIIELTGDRYAVGSPSTDQVQTLFSSYYVPLQADDAIYIFSDGYVDQFGGADGKKFKMRRFRHLLLNICNLPINSQRQQLYDTITNWMGDQEQVDDILVIGIKPDLSCIF